MDTSELSSIRIRGIFNKKNFILENFIISINILHTRTSALKRIQFKTHYEQTRKRFFRSSPQKRKSNIVINILGTIMYLVPIEFYAFNTT